MRGLPGRFKRGFVACAGQQRLQRGLEGVQQFGFDGLHVFLWDEGLVRQKSAFHAGRSAESM